MSSIITPISRIDHHWSECHIHRYLAEFDFRYSTKNANDFERSEICLKNIAGKRLA